MAIKLHQKDFYHSNFLKTNTKPSDFSSNDNVGARQATDFFQKRSLAYLIPNQSYFPASLLIVISFFQRSPSPEPIYSSEGKRMNTREYRKRRELEEQRHRAIQKMLQLNPEFKPPMDYK